MTADLLHSRTFAFCGGLALAVAVSLVYLPAARGPFIYDDVAAVVENESIRSVWPLFGTGQQRGPLRPPVESPLATRPLVNFSFAINHRIVRQTIGKPIGALPG